MGWLGYALLSALFAGLIAVFVKVGLAEVDSTLATTVRSVVMASLLLALSLWRGNLAAAGEISARAWVFVLLSGLAGAISWLCYFRALELGDAVRVAPIDRLSLLVTFACAIAFLGEKVSAGVALGMLLVLAGSVLVARG